MLVDPRPGAEFARLVHADTLAVPSACGHSVFWCEDRRIGSACSRVRSRARRTWSQPLLAVDAERVKRYFFVLSGLSWL